MEETQVAIRAAKEAGKLLMENFDKVHSVEAKSQQEIVTEADIESEKIILGILKENFPEYSILSEELGKETRGSEFMWIVDPLDGTTNYSIRNPFFDVSIALAKSIGEAWEIVSGVVHAPFTREMFCAEKGRGSYLNNEKILVSKEPDIRKLLLVYCSGTSEYQIRRSIEVFSRVKPVCRDLTRMRAGALELAMVADGRLGAYISPGGKPWDSAAGQLLVMEAGGKVTDFEGDNWSPEGSERDIVASNGKIHGEMLKILKQNKGKD